MTTFFLFCRRLLPFFSGTDSLTRGVTHLVLGFNARRGFGLFVLPPELSSSFLAAFDHRFPTVLLSDLSGISKGATNEVEAVVGAMNYAWSLPRDSV